MDTEEKQQKQNLGSEQTKNNDLATLVTFDKFLSRGTYGAVYTCAERPQSVFKVFFDITLPPTNIELDCMFRLHHPYVMGAKGLYTIKSVPKKLKKGFEVLLYPNNTGKYLVIEMEKAEGDLLTFDKNVTYEEKLKMVWQMLQGIHFIHSCHLLHLDIKSENILVMSDGNIKITDFGLCIPLTTHGRSRVYKRELITANYRPPENHTPKKKRGGILRNPNQYIYSQKSDVWSLGVVICELFMNNDRTFIENKQLNLVDKMFTPEMIENTIKTKIGRGLSREKMNLWYPVLRDMLSSDINKRPTISQLLNMPIFDPVREEVELKDSYVIQPLFPPPKTTLDSEEYALKLEYFICNVIHILSQIIHYRKEQYPIQLLFIAADLFLRYRHLYESTDEMMPIVLYISTQLLYEYEIDFLSLEHQFQVEGLEQKWVEFLFRTSAREDPNFEYADGNALLHSNFKNSTSNSKIQGENTNQGETRGKKDEVNEEKEEMNREKDEMNGEKDGVSGERGVGIEKNVEAKNTRQGSEYKCIFLSDTPFSHANCKCRLEKMLKMLCIEPEAYVEFYKTNDFSTHPCLEKCCGVNPSWYLEDWLDYIFKLKPSIKPKK